MRHPLYHVITTACGGVAVMQYIYSNSLVVLLLSKKVCSIHRSGLIFYMK